MFTGKHMQLNHKKGFITFVLLRMSRIFQDKLFYRIAAEDFILKDI